jgi:hypothetical protein
MIRIATRARRIFLSMRVMLACNINEEGQFSYIS